MILIFHCLRIPFPLLKLLSSFSMNLNILRSSSLLLLVFSMFVPVFAQDEGLDKVSTRAADLEAQVRKLDASTVEGANVLLELIDLYHTNARGFGLIRAGKIFVKTDPFVQ